MSLRRRLLPLAVPVLVAGAVLALPTSGATYVSTSASTVTVRAATDWTPPVVSVDDPGAAISGTATIAVTASDVRSGVATVSVEYAPADSGAWKSLCTDTTAPYSCSWNTTSGATAVSDGSYDLRATAVDGAGYSAVSVVRTTRVVNSAAVVLSPVADPARGQVSLTATYVSGGVTTANLSFQLVPAGGTAFKDVPGCGYSALVVGNTRTCTWDTTTTATGEYDVRAVALTSLGRTYYDTQLAVVVDNTAPTTTLVVPAGPLSGTVLLSAAAVDDDSGMAAVTFQHRRAGAGAWSDCGTDPTEPWTCSLRTTSLADGSYDFRAVATDNAGNSTITAAQTRTVNNTVSSISLTSPAAGETLRGVATLTADANSTAGVVGVAFQVRPVGGSWTTACTTSVAPYACAWDTSAILSAGYEVRAALTDGTGAVTTSAAVAVSVDNQPLRALDVQVANVTTAGSVAAGDRITLTYSTVVDLATIQSGWSGASTTLTASFSDKGVAGSPRAGYDWTGFGGANLGKLSLAQDYVRKNKSVSFAATMTATTQSVNGAPATVVTVTLGSTSGQASLRRSTLAGSELWYPSTLVRTPGGLACSPSSAVESGTLDSDF